MIDPKSRHERGGHRRGKGEREGQVNLIDGRIKGEGRGKRGKGKGERGDGKTEIWKPETGCRKLTIGIWETFRILRWAKTVMRSANR